MKSVKYIVIALALIMTLTACGDSNSTAGDTGTTAPPSVSPTESDSPSPQIPSALPTPPESVSPSSEITSYETKELSRDENYKRMEMYVKFDTKSYGRRITFEIPADWHVIGSVFANGESFQYTLKVDMWDVVSATRDDVLIEYNERDEIGGIISENIYSTETYEIFQYKFTDTEGEAHCISAYYLYANGERFHLTSYVFTEDKPEYDEIFKRIVESVRFQF